MNRSEISFLNKENNVEVNGNSTEKLSPADEARKIEFEEETQLDIEKITELLKPENLIKLSEEKRKFVIDKIKVLMAILIALGVYTASQNFDAMESASKLSGQATTEAMVGFAGTVTALLGVIGFGIRNAYNKFKLEEERQNPKIETI
jgi:hypothetical protein